MPDASTTTFHCAAPPQASYAYYEQTFRERGWTFVGQTRHGERRVLVLTIRDTPGRIPLRRATLVVEPAEDGSQVRIFESFAHGER